MRRNRFKLVYPIAAAALAASALIPAAMASGSTGPAPARARITGAAIPGSRTPATYVAPAGLPSRQQQIKVLTAALKFMRAHYKGLFQQGVPGVADIFDYNVGPLWLKGIDGAGTTIAVLEGWDDPHVGSVVAGFDKLFHLPNPAIQTIFPVGKLPKTCPPGMVKLGGYGSCDAWEGELELDVITAHMIAPYAKIVISATPADTQEADDPASNVAMPEMMKALEFISARHLANVMSISDGTGETTYGAGAAQIRAQDAGELAAAAAGIPVLVATGDCGVVQNLAVANGQCEDVSPTPDTAAWDDSPWITAVGGSVPNMSATAPKKLGPDPVWNTPPFSEGAGFSSVYPRPAYQAGLPGGPMRSVPDITMDSQDGTSEAAPMLAGFLALATQVHHGDLGPVNPALYRLGPDGVRDGITDVVAGDNSVINSKGQVTVPGFTAGRGFDVASGWGTINAPRFVPSLAAETRMLGNEAAARAQARAELDALEQHGTTMTRTRGGDVYLLGTGFLPGHPVALRIDGRLIDRLMANSLGDITYMVDPSLLGLGHGHHHVAISGLVITETASFTS